MKTKPILLYTCILSACLQFRPADADRRRKRQYGNSRRFCFTSISQRTNQHCKLRRVEELAQTRKFYKFSRSETEYKTGYLDQSRKEVLDYFMTEKFHSHWYTLYFDLMMDKLTKVLGPFMALKYKHVNMTNYQLYLQVAKEMKDSFMNAVNNRSYYRYPSRSYKYFTDISINERFRDDRYFTQLRLAGLNPMAIRRVVDEDEKVGTKMSDLQKRLSKKFNLNKAVTSVTKDADIDESISKKKVYVVEYPMLNNLTVMPDTLSVEKGAMQMAIPLAPIAIFAVDPAKELKIVFIQNSSTADGHIHTPADGQLWNVTKAQLQISDMFAGEIMEHLMKTHYKMEPLCIALYRHLSKMHPLHQILKYHCRGLLPVNAYGVNVLLRTSRGTRSLFGYGNRGAEQLIKQELPKMAWNDIDLEVNIKERGLGDEEQLPYYPYRDDGRKINRVLRGFAQDLVERLYRWNSQIARDFELQNMIKELSTKIKGLPSKFRTRGQLSKFLRETLWIVVHHSSLNYPVTEYAMSPAMNPTKLYKQRVPGETSNFVQLLPGPLTAVLQGSLSVGLGSLYYDSFFDYWNELISAKLRRVVLDAYAELQQVNHEIDYENRKRFKKGQLTNPYMLPSWMPNSIST